MAWLLSWPAEGTSKYAGVSILVTTTADILLGNPFPRTVSSLRQRRRMRGEENLYRQSRVRVKRITVNFLSAVRNSGKRDLDNASTMCRAGDRRHPRASVLSASDGAVRFGRVIE